MAVAPQRRRSKQRGSQGEPCRVSRRDPQAPLRRRPAALDDLYRLPMPKLFAVAEREGITEHTGMSRGQLIMAIVRHQIERGATVRGSGTLEVLPDGYGFLRSVAHNYLASPEDIYVSPSQIRRLGLKTGLIVEGPIRLPVEGQDNFALMQVDLVNAMRPTSAWPRTDFEDLTPLHPNRRLVLETDRGGTRPCAWSIWSRRSARASAA